MEMPQEHLELIYKFARENAKKFSSRGLGNDAEADLVGELYMVYANAKEKFDENNQSNASFETYLTSAFINYCKKYYAKHSRIWAYELFLLNNDELPEGIFAYAADALGDYEYKHDMKNILRHFQGADLVLVKNLLEPGEAVLSYLFNVVVRNDGKSIQGVTPWLIGRVFGMSKMEVKRRMEKIRKKLKKILY